METNTEPIEPIIVKRIQHIEYKCREDVPETIRPRTARIIFEDDKFIECHFEVWSKSKYSLQDWLFIGQIAEFIKELTTK